MFKELVQYTGAALLAAAGNVNAATGLPPACGLQKFVDAEYSPFIPSDIGSDIEVRLEFRHFHTGPVMFYNGNTFRESQERTPFSEVVYYETDRAEIVRARHFDTKTDLWMLIYDKGTGDFSMVRDHRVMVPHIGTTLLEELEDQVCHSI